MIISLILLVIVVAVFAHPAVAQSDKLGYLRIKTQYPVQVPRSYTFQINVTVQYAFREYYDVQAAIYEGSKGTLANALWQGTTEHLIGVSEKTYKVQIQSPAQEAQWVITGYAFYYIASGPGYFSDQERGPGFVEMRIKVSDNAKLTFRTPHGNMPVSLDGTKLTTGKDGTLVREVKVLTEHSISAPQNVVMADGWRAIFHSWNGTDHQNPKSLKVAKDLSITVDYRDEFRLDLISDVDHVVGAGWYQAGVIANFSAPAFVPQDGLGGVVGIRWHFTGWSGDIKSATNEESVVMDHPYSVVANWGLDYEQSYYLGIGLAVLAAAALIAFLLRRAMTKKPPSEEEREEEEETAENEEEEDKKEHAPPLVRKFCIRCGAKIETDARSCARCGEDQVSSE